MVIPPLFSSKPPLKTEVLSSPPFWKFGRRFNSLSPSPLPHSLPPRWSSTNTLTHLVTVWPFHLFETKTPETWLLLTITTTEIQGFINYWHGQKLSKPLLFMKNWYSYFFIVSLVCVCNVVFQELSSI